MGEIMEKQPWHLVDLRDQKGGQIRIFDEYGKHVANVLASNPYAQQVAESIVQTMNAASGLAWNEQ